MRAVKVLGNNVIVASNDRHDEVILVGKGIGFNRATGSTIDPSAIEKTFVLHDEQEQARYKQLLTQTDDKVILCMNEVMFFLKEEFGTLPQELLVNLTAHVSFCISRIQSGMVIQNSLLEETSSLYPGDFIVAEKVCQIICKSLDMQLPDDEIGLIALYIHAVSNECKLEDVKKNTKLISIVMNLIESKFDKKIDKTGVYYNRFLHHLRFTITRIQSSNYMSTEVEVSKLIKESYPESFQLACEIGEVLGNHLNVDVPESELVYLTIHIERIMA